MGVHHVVSIVLQVDGQAHLHGQTVNSALPFLAPTGVHTRKHAAALGAQFSGGMQACGKACSSLLFAAA